MRSIPSVPIVCLALGLSVAAAADPIRIATVVDGPWERNAEILDLFRSEIRKLTESEFDVVFPDDLASAGDWTLEGVRAALERTLEDPRTDIVLAMGVLAGDIVSKRGGTRVPVIAPFVIDRELQQLPFDDGASGVTNLSYLDGPDPLAQDLQAFLEVASFERFAFLTAPAFVAAVPALATSLDRAASANGVSVAVVPAAGDAAAVLARIPDDVGAVYLAPLPQLGSGAFDELVAGINARGLPTFSFLGRPDVERGVLAGLRPVSYFERLARRTALHVQSVLLGENAGTLSVAFSTKDRLVINMATARQIGVLPSFAILTEAELIDEARNEAQRSLTLSDVVAEAARRNLELAAAERDVAATRSNVGIARGRLLPQLDVSARGVLIDDDRAAASLGAQAERTISASASLSQLLWSEPAWAGLSGASHTLRSREAARDAQRLDTIAAAAGAYLGVLIRKTIERIERSNLELTRQNLELAQVRESVGTAGPSEVLRWKSAIATGRKTVIEANAERNVAEMQLNRVLDRPLEESFLTAETSVDDPALISSDARLDRYLDDPWTFRRFREFMIREGRLASPELAEIDAAIAAQSRVLASATNAFFSPTLSIQGEVSHELEASGAGSGGSPLEIPGVELPQADETEFSVALVASIPLSRGGARLAERTQASETLMALRLRRQAVASSVELRIRAALHRLGAARAGISLTRDAADAAGRNLEIVTDAYRRGVAPIIDLLDSQNASRVAEQAAANAVYAFLVQLMEVERAVGRFDFFTTAGDRDAFFERLAAFVADTDAGP